MKGWTRIIPLALALALIFSLMSSAAADVMTVGVYFRGIVEQADGSSGQVPLSGSFRVMQGGMDRGVIQAGESTVTVEGTDPVTLVPMPETIPAGWDLSEAQVMVEMLDGGNVNVPILVHPSAEGAALPVSNEQPAMAASVITTGNVTTPEQETPATETTVPVTGTSGVVVVTQTASAATETETKAQAAVTAVETPQLTQQTVVVTAAPTAEPEVSQLAASAETGTFHIKVFYDSNNNGDCSVYEKGVAEVQVYLVSADGQVVTGGKTNAEGEITLPGLTPGSYRVRVYLDEQWGFNRKSKDTGLNKSIMDFSSEGNQDSDPIQVAAGETVERGVGLLKGVVVDGVCWLDTNADGIMDASEPRLAGVHITMNGQKNGLSFEAYSDENGYWRIYRLRAGFYDFSSYAPEGMMFTRYSKTGGKNRSVFTTEGKTKATKTLDLNDGRNDLDQNIGFAWQGSVSGIAFLDANYNGLYDEGEKPMAGVKVTAIKQNKDEEVAVSYTDEEGRYTLGGLRGGTFRIRAVLPDDGSNFTVAVEDPLGNHFVARDNRRENFWKDFEVQDGESRTVNVGVIYYGSVSGTVYMDDDFSGNLSSGEKVSQGVSVTLLDSQGAAVATKQTSAKGAYSFTGLTPGRYSLRMTAKAGYAFTRLGDGNVMLNLNGGEGYSEAFEVPLGQEVSGKDAGMIMPGTVKGMVFADRNDNGRRDSDEAGLAGTKVRLMSEAGEEFSATVTDNGEFLFDAVMPGRYYLEYELPTDGIFAQAGGDNTIFGEEGVGRGEWFDFRTADQKEAPLCGGLTLGALSGSFFHDEDGSGTQQAEDVVLAGMRLTLTPDREELAAVEAVSDEYGEFKITGLHPDNYQLTLQLPEGLVTVRTVGVQLPLVAGKNEQTVRLTVAMGQRWEDQEIGGVKPGYLAGAAWLDENNNGIQEEGEQTPGGLAIQIIDEDSGEVFALLPTGEDGSFLSAGMIPGRYTVSLTVDDNTDLPPAGDNTFRKEGNHLIRSGISLGEGEAIEGLVLGMVKYTALAGNVWIDRGNMTQALSGAKVSLLDGEGNLLQTQTTAESGDWRFSGLMPGEYRIQAELPEGTVAAEPDDERLQMGLISILQETEGRRGWSDLIDLKMGQDQLKMNIGSVLPGTIGDFCWLDLNKNGWQDGGELGIPNVKVELVRNGVTAAETITDQYGLYFFREVYPAVYTLKVTAPEQVKPTQKRTDIYLIVSSLLESEDSVAHTDAFAVASDSTNFNIDLGFVLRNEGDYPAGYGQQDTQDWSKAYEGVEVK
ncbi:MAG: carboxypeptidase regulatory-like domain-containing protein [Clostridia bacterium]|nr:carboxypeptidase regulatory-like domain-containing protein [Clostridia bacterium]